MATINPAPPAVLPSPVIYTTEIAAFGTSIVGVPTAVPVFIGYTEFAGDPTTGAALYNTPVAITSMVEFSGYFGGPAPRRFTVTPNTTAPSFSADYTTPNANPAPGSSPFTVAPTGFGLEPAAPAASRFNLYWQMQLFFANGGGQCYVVSVGSYWAGQLPAAAPDPIPAAWIAGTISAGDPDSTPATPGLLVGLQAAGEAVGPTMTVIPEACQLGLSDYALVAQAMLAQAGTLGDRMAILDLPGALDSTTLASLQTAQTNLSTAIGPQSANFSYGCVYAPALNASVVGPGDVLFASLLAAAPADNTVINNILTTQANRLYSGAQLGAIQPAIAAAFPLTGAASGSNTVQYSGDASAYPAPANQTPAALRQWRSTLNSLLLNALPVLGQIETLVAGELNIAPASGALAGVWTASDSMNGVWTAPANIALQSVVAPLCSLTDSEQAGFNVPVNGQAIDIIRGQINRGNVVWGARTLDGNSQDYRYIQVRRTLIYVEQSIKLALQPYAFAANDSTTWSTVTAAISAFLTNLWQQGGLMGAKPSDAFSAACGLGSTMTAQDILDGKMIVAVTLQMVHPAEFITLSFTQAMGT